MISQLTRLAVTIIITVLLLQACVGCAVSKNKTMQRTDKDSTTVTRSDSQIARNVVDTVSKIGVKTTTTQSDATYTITTTDSPVVVYVLDTFYIDRVRTIREQGRIINNTIYIDSFAEQRRRLIEENTALKKAQDVKMVSSEVVKEKEKETKWPWWWVPLLAAGLFCIWVYKKAT